MSSIKNGTLGYKKDQVQKIQTFLDKTLKSWMFSPFFKNSEPIFNIIQDSDPKNELQILNQPKQFEDAVYTKQTNKKLIVLNITDISSNKLNITPFVFCFYEKTQQQEEQQKQTQVKQLKQKYKQAEKIVGKQPKFQKMLNTLNVRIDKINALDMSDEEKKEKIGKLKKQYMTNYVKQYQSEFSDDKENDKKNIKKDTIVIDSTFNIDTIEKPIQIKVGMQLRDIIDNINKRIKGTGCQLDIDLGEDIQKKNKKKQKEAEKKAERQQGKKQAINALKTFTFGKD